MARPSILDARGDEIRVPAGSGARFSPGVLPVVLMPRRVPGGVLATLDDLPAEALPRLDYAGPAAGLRRAMRAALAERLPRPRWLANWLLDDVLDHAATLAALSGAASLRVMLDAFGEAAEDGAEAPLAAAEGRCRLVTAYRGAGFDWLPPRAARGLPLGGPVPAALLASLLRRLPRGDVAILRGEADDGPGVAHRAAFGRGIPLLLTIDAAGRTAASPVGRSAVALQ